MTNRVSLPVSDLSLGIKLICQTAPAYHTSEK